MPVDRLPGAFLPLLYVLAVLVLSAMGAVWVLRREREAPSSYSLLGVPVHLPGEGPSLEEWAGMSTEEQEAWDNAALPGPANLRQTPEEAELEARADAHDAAEHMVHRAQINALFHP